MLPHELIEEYLDKVVPKNISEKKQRLICQELESHIYDKADFYMEIGFGEEESYKKAVCEMGNTDEVCSGFQEVYHEKDIYSVITFLWIVLTDVFAALSGFGGLGGIWYWATGVMMFSLESTVISWTFLGCVIFLIIYAHKEKYTKTLKAIGLAHLIMTLLPLFINSIYFPVAYLISIAANNLNFGDMEHFILYFGSEFISAPLCIISFILSALVKKNKLKNTSERKHKIASIIVAVICIFANVLCICLYSINNDIYGGSSVIEDYFIENKYKKDITEVYNRITKEMTFAKVDEVLRKEGFVPHTELEKLIDDQEEVKYSLEYINDFMVENKGKDTVYIRITDEGYADLSVGFVISFSEAETIAYKKLIGSFYIKENFFSYLKNNNYSYKVDSARKKFEQLKLGDDKHEALSLIGKIGDFEYVLTEFDVSLTRESYKLNIYENEGAFGLTDNKYFNAYLIFENDCLTGGKYDYLYEYSEYDGKTDDMELKEITETYEIEN